MKIKIITTIENVVDLDQLKRLTKNQIKKQLRKDIKIAQIELMMSVIYETKKVINSKNHQNHLMNLKEKAIKEFEESLDELLTSP